jgi:hypothetical protein
MSIITKGMGAIMKAKMKAAGVTKATFPGPNAGTLLNQKVKNFKKKGMKSQNVMESYAGVDARINRKLLKDFNPGKK